MVRFKIREDSLAKLLFIRNNIISWLNIKDISVLYKGKPLNVGITETERYPFVEKIT